MYNIYDAFENFKFERIMNHDFLQVKECIDNFNIHENQVIMEGFLDDILDYEPVTEGVKDVAKKIIDFIKEVWRKIKEWFKNVIGHFKKQKSVKAECEEKIKQVNEKAKDAPAAPASAAPAPAAKKDNRSAREIYKEKSSKTRAARRECHSLEEVLHNSNLSVKLFAIDQKLTDLPPIVREGLENMQDAAEQLISGEMEFEEFDENCTADGELGKRMTKLNEKVESESVPVKNHVDFIMSVLNDKDDVVKTLQQMEKDNDNIMNGYIKMCQNIGQGAQDHFDAVAARIKKALNMSTQCIKDAVGTIGRLFGICNGIAKKATAEYAAALAPYKD